MQVQNNADLTSILKPWEVSPEDLQVDFNDSKAILGIGGFATVFKGTYQGQSVAVKRLHRVPRTDLDDLRRLIAQEINGWRQISHEPYILTLLGVCTTIPTPIIVTELCQTNIRRYVRDHPETLLPVVYQFAKGLVSIHNANLIHQNLKADNVLVTFQKKVVIADFGESLLAQDVSPDTQARGTLNWMSPEQYLNPQSMTTKTDIWSFGMTLWAMKRHIETAWSMNFEMRFSALKTIDLKSLTPWIHSWSHCGL
ncbi:hypothetical protein AeMF1_013628 [Aphanomyces euteiches]|nr:hypothetical protein AeMF1_013628 [Aphanomyces euteiches]KAH9188237.1 hypothetical protein AeNC1_009784 [Aphanomyces euteiches]